jgi:hypothetical protein
LEVFGPVGLGIMGFMGFMGFVGYLGFVANIGAIKRVDLCHGLLPLPESESNEFPVVSKAVVKRNEVRCKMTYGSGEME